MNQKYSWGVLKTGVKNVAHLWRDATISGSRWSACGLCRTESIVGSPITDYPRCKICEKTERKLITEITGH